MLAARANAFNLLDALYGRQELKRIKMGYLDNVTKATFKKVEDRRLLFFPWGALGRGYIIASDDDLERMRSPFKMFALALLFTLAISFTLVFILKSAIGLIPVAAVTMCYAVWAHYKSRGLRSLPLRESLTIHSLGTSVRSLWFSVVLYFFMVLSSMLQIVNQHGEWFVPLIGIVIFGYFVVIHMRMLLIRRQHQMSNGA